MRKIILFMLVVFLFALSGCNLQTVDELYCLPQRPDVFADLQSVINGAMAGLEYSAPISGEHQQSVQAMDLTGDGEEEYIVFAKGNDEKPLQILVFTKVEEDFVLLDKILSTGTAFEQVEYIRMDARAGYEMVVGRKVSDQVLRSVSVYSFYQMASEQVLSMSCSRFMCSELTGDGHQDLLVLRPGEAVSAGGIAELYTMQNGVAERAGEAPMSDSAGAVRRIVTGRLEDGFNAVFVASSVGDSMLVTDVFAVVDESFTNICRPNTSDTVVQTQRDYNVFADDIDNDGILELPKLVPMHQNSNFGNPS